MFLSVNLSIAWWGGLASGGSLREEQAGVWREGADGYLTWKPTPRVGKEVQETLRQRGSISSLNCDGLRVSLTARPPWSRPSWRCETQGLLAVA